MCPGKTTPAQMDQRAICLHPSIRISFACKVRHHLKLIESSFAAPPPNGASILHEYYTRVELNWKEKWAGRVGAGHQYVNFYYQAYLEIT